MRYFLVVGESSGDVHASRLMQELRKRDPEAEFCFFGGDQMSIVGGTRLRHYRSVAYMGFIPVLLHLPAILQAMKVCRRFVLRWRPDVTILVDYPGFNLGMAKFVHRNTDIPVYYYILPKVWAWKEGRVRQLRKYVDERFSILPFEVPFFEKKHHCPIHYVGNPSADEIYAFTEQHPRDFQAFCQRHSLNEQPVIALLPGSRRQEIKDNFRRMVLAAKSFAERGYQIIVAAAQDIPDAIYSHYLQGTGVDMRTDWFHLLRDATLSILQHAEAALVTSGTATLETALLKVPQVVCYYAPLGHLVRAIKPHFLHVKYISLVNLILDRELVPELIGDQVNPHRMQAELERMVVGGTSRQTVLDGYDRMIQRLGAPGAPQRAASIMVDLLRERSTHRY